MEYVNWKKITMQTLDKYNNRLAYTEFVKIHSWRLYKQAFEQYSKARCYSVLFDGSTECANMEDQLFVVLFVDSFDNDRRVHVKSKFLSVRQSCSVSELYDCFNRTMSNLDKVIGFECDGTKVRDSIEEVYGNVVVWWSNYIKVHASMDSILFLRYCDEVFTRF